MNTRTWPYGTRKKVKILNVDMFTINSTPSGPPRGRVIVCEHVDDPAEETICIFNDEVFAGITPRPAKGQVREMEFTEGGPTGGYWMILSEVAK